MAAERPLRLLLVDDEPLAVERLQVLCAQLEGVELVGAASDGEAALRLIERLAPDWILLDISMPGLGGLDVARAIERSPVRPCVVFCTAFDEFALAAFDASAVDYVLKPVSLERLVRAAGRVREASARRGAGTTSPWLEHIWVPHRSEMLRIAVHDIDRIDAERDYMRLHVGARSYLVHQTLAELERKLSPDLFLRLHRSMMARRDHVHALKGDGMGGWRAVLADGREVRIGRTYLPTVKSWIKAHWN